jgi:hypothetical protein
MIVDGLDPQRADEFESLEEADFLANLDFYLDGAEAGCEFRLVRDGKTVCYLRPAD